MAIIKQLARYPPPKLTLARKNKDFALDYTVHSNLFKALTC
ncbi:hypothetical protein PsAD37_03176 [Pseudovibrio sp. Ad37]|nr:hypothetical protein PsAD37_03176 [Pseudovibrio sp. Ad37]